MTQTLQPSTRIISLVSAIALGLVFFLPIWRIDLAAPQYPEGLYLQIYASKLGGDVDVINGLNHYIGMNHIHEKDFVEFKILPTIILALSGFGILTAIINRKWFYFTWFGCLLAFGIIAMFDFYHWLYNYGHNLDPAAAIKVPGQSYQPPLIGYKQLLNFGAYSMPDSGGWLFIIAGVLLLVGVWIEVKKSRSRFSQKISVLSLTAVVLMFSACSDAPKPIPFGKQSCDYCKMTLLEPLFGTELVSDKGKTYFFDDLTCLTGYIKEKQPGTAEGYNAYMSNYLDATKLLHLEQAFLYQSDAIKGPMGGNTVAFATEAERSEFSKSKAGQAIHWKQLLQQ